MICAYLISKQIPNKPSATRSILLVDYSDYNTDLRGILYAGQNRPGDNVWTKGYLKDNMILLKEYKDD